MGQFTPISEFESIGFKVRFLTSTDLDSPRIKSQIWPSNPSSSARSGMGPRGLEIMRDNPSEAPVVGSNFRALGKSRNDLAQLLVGSDAGIWEYDLLNKSFSRDIDWFRNKLGPVMDEPSGKDYHGHLVHPADLSRFNERVLGCILGKTDVFEIEYRVATREKESIWLQTRGFVLERSASGRAQRIVGTDHVIEDYREVRRLLSIEKTLLRGLNAATSRGEALNVLLQTIRRDHGYASVCVLDLYPHSMDVFRPTILADTLFRPGSVQAGWLAEQFSDHDRTGVEELGGTGDPFGPVLPKSMGFRGLLRAVIHQEGRLTAVFLIGLRTPVAFDHTEIASIGNYCIQIQTALDRIEREDRLKQREKAWEYLVDAIDDHLVVLDSFGNILHANERFRRSFVSDRPPNGNSWNLRDFYPYLNDGSTEIDQILRGPSLELSLPLRDGSGDLRLLETKTFAGEWHGVPAVFCGMRDAARRERSLNQLRERDELLRATAEALGAMIAIGEADPANDSVIERVAESFRSSSLILYESVLGETGTLGFNPLMEWRSGSLEPGESRISFADWRKLPFDTDEERFFSIAARDLSGDQRALLRVETGVRILFIAIRVHDRDWGYLRVDLDADGGGVVENHLWLLQILGSGLATQVVRARLEESLRKATEETENTNRQLEVAIEQARISAEEARRADRSKSEFLANISHEIRTPLNAILGFAELLNDEIKDRRHLEYLRAINASGSALLTVINDLLDLSRIEAGKLELHPENCDLQVTFEEIERIFFMEASRKALDLVLRVETEFPKRLFLDPARIRQVLFNLVGNAVKFTNQGRVVVEAGFERRSDMTRKGTLCLRVLDTGPGIEAGKMETIFEPFERIEQLGRNQVGTGLGLAICMRLIKIMGGEILVESKVGEGSCFEIRLPDIVCESEEGVTLPGQEHEASLHQTVLSGKRVLVVDDSPFDRLLAETALRDLGVDFKAAESVRAGLQQLRDFRPHLVLLDLQMPGESGDRFLAELIRGAEFDPFPEVLVWSALEHNRMKSYLKRFEGIATLSKPIRRNTFLRQLVRVIETAPTRTSLAGWGERGTDAPAPVTPLSTILPGAERSAAVLHGETGEDDDGLNQLGKECERVGARMQTSLIEAFLDHCREYLNQHPDFRALENWIDEVERAFGSFDVLRLKNLLKQFPRSGNLRS